MFTRRRNLAPVQPVVRDYTYFYRASYYVFRATTVEEARKQLRAELSAQAEREAQLTSVR